MTTLAANLPRAYGSGGHLTHYPMIASDIIYEGAGLGLVDASGHARPLTSADVFGGFADRKADNSAGAAAAVNVQARKEGLVELTVSGITITDKGRPVYATDDNTFTMSPVGGVYVGIVERWVSSGKGEVRFNVGEMADPYADYPVREAITGAKTLDIQDNGKLFWVTATAVVTLPAVATPINCLIVNGGAFGTVQISVDPNANDKVQGPDLPGTDNKDLINTLATARRGDFVELMTGNADGPLVRRLRGTWATEG